MLTLRQRGTHKIWYIRGSVTVSNETIIVKEHSTGCNRREAAEACRAKLQAEIQDQIIFGKSAAHKKIIFDDVIRSYINRPVKTNGNDLLRLRILTEHMTGTLLKDIKARWLKFIETEYIGKKPATIARMRTILLAAMNYYAQAHDIDVPKIPGIRVQNDRIRMLSETEEVRLLGSYSDSAKPIALMYCFQGCRTQEGLQLQWSDIQFSDDQIVFGRTKSKKPRAVPMHPYVRTALEKIWESRGRPDSGHVFLNTRGKPYADTRDYKIPGGNPLRAAHKTACKLAGIQDFRVHDWRHHWASRCMMSDMDVESIRRMGGWHSLDMLQRYAAVNTKHMREAIRKLSR